MFLRKIRLVHVLVSGLLLCGCNISIRPCYAPQMPVVSGNATTIAGVILPSHLSQVDVSPTDDHELVFSSSPGGAIESTEQLVQRFKRVRVSGITCKSACVMVLTKFDHVCVDRTVKQIVFHTISNVKPIFGGKYCRRITNHRATQEYIDTLPPALYEQVKELPSHEMTIPISLEEFLKHYPNKVCSG